MKACILFGICALVVPLHAQETRTEIRTRDATAEDLRANSDSIPGGYAVYGKFARVAVLRFKYDTDLLLGLERLIRTEHIRNAVILAGIGSVRNYHVHVVGNRTLPTANVHIRDATGPADITGMNGYVIDGRVHAHITFANAGKACGGHLEEGTTVFTFAIVTIGILDDTMDLENIDNSSYR